MLPSEIGESHTGQPRICDIDPLHCACPLREDDHQGGTLEEDVGNAPYR